MRNPVEGVVFLLLGLPIGGWVVVSLHRGRFRDRRWLITRAAEPTSFWFFVIFYALFSIGATWAGIHDLVAP